MRLETGAGAWLAHRFTETGATLASLLPGMLERALERLPAPRRMRWADRDTEFVRPVHWVVLMHGGEVVEAEILGVRSGRVTRGHRFHHDFRRTGGIALEDAGRYEAALRDEGRVVAGFEERMEIIREQVERETQALGGRALIDPELLEENTALVEWPVAVAGHFDAAFLVLPDAVLTATMQGHQRYFPVAGEDGALMPHFIAVSNIASRDVETVRKGNERVIRPRLSDAAYFFDADRRRTLESHLDGLKDVVFQRKLGTLRARRSGCQRSPGAWRRAMGRSGGAAEASHARRAGLLSKCDSLTEMVGEFPELQGRMAASTRAATASRRRWPPRSARSTCRASRTTRSPPLRPAVRWRSPTSSTRWPASSGSGRRRAGTRTPTPCAAPPSGCCASSSRPGSTSISTR